MKSNFDKLLEKIAHEFNSTPDEVYKEMQIAIDAGFNNPDPQVQAMWANIKYPGEKPTPEDVIPYLTKLAGDK